MKTDTASLIAYHRREAEQARARLQAALDKLAEEGSHQRERPSLDREVDFGWMETHMKDARKAQRDVLDNERIIAVLEKVSR